MPENEVPEELEDVVKEKMIDKLEPQLVFNRYIWLKTFKLKYTNENIERLTRLWKSADQEIDEIIAKLVATDPLLPAKIIRKAVQSKSLHSFDQLLWCVAFCLKKVDSKDLHRQLWGSFLELVPDQNELLYFINHYDNRGEVTEDLKSKKISFGRGMRDCLRKWYDQRSASELLEIVFASPKVEKFSHSRVLHMIHFKSDNEDKNEIMKASHMSYDEIKAAAETSTTMKKILKYQDLKRSQDIAEVIAILKAKNFNYKLQHLPTNALKSVEVIDLILPNISLLEILDNLGNLANRKLLRVQEPVAKKICASLQCSNKVIHEAKLNPIYVLEVMKTLEKKLMVHDGAKDESDATASDTKSKDKEKKFSNPFVIKKLLQLFNQSLSDRPKTGCRFYITVDFRKFSKRQATVSGQKNSDMLCSEAQAALALCLLKNEKDVTVMSFTDDKNKLKPVAWTADMSYEKAMEIYDKEIKEKPKTKQNILLPLKKATEDKKKVDVFITIVDSIGRVSGKGVEPPLEELENYRKALNLKMTRLVVINLARKSADFAYKDANINAKGVLEIVGFGADTLSVIEAFAKNCFV